MIKPLFRARDGRPAEVTPVELFFDLIFVFAVTQVSHFLLDHLSPLGALEAALLLLAVWSAWVDTALITNLLDPERQLVRTVLMLLTGLGLVFSAALPDAFGERGMAFAFAFVAFQLGRTLFVLWAARPRPALFRNFLRVFIWTAVYCSLWLAGAFATGEMRLSLWVLALSLDFLPPVVNFPVPGLGRLNTRELAIDGSHLAERTGLFILIALGESIVATGTRFAELAWAPAVVAAMVAAFLQSVAMWWIYFFWSSDLARAAITRSDDPARFGRRLYIYVPWLMVAGLVASAVGDSLAIDAPLGQTSLAAAWVLIGGPALFLLGALIFAFNAAGHWSEARLGGLIALLALAFLAPVAPPLVLSAASAMILIAVAVTERLLFARHPKAKGTDSLG